MQQYNPDILARLVSEFRKSTTRLKALAQLPENYFLKDPDKIGSTKYHFIVAIECCIDICSHLISKNELRAPEDYADTFRVMEEEGVFDAEFADELVKMAKFRNRLVHLYWEVEDRQLLSILRSRLGDFEKLERALASYLELNAL